MADQECVGTRANVSIADSNVLPREYPVTQRKKNELVNAVGSDLNFKVTIRIMASAGTAKVHLPDMIAFYRSLSAYRLRRT